MNITKEQGNLIAQKVKELSIVIETMQEDNKSPRYEYKFKPQPFRRFARGD